MGLIKKEREKNQTQSFRSDLLGRLDRKVLLFFPSRNTSIKVAMEVARTQFYRQNFAF